MDISEPLDSSLDEVPQAMAFTVTFETASAKKPNKFIKRHSRNLSLPVVSVYENNVTQTVNGTLKKPGNHSEGYFSSDPEDELTAQSTSSKITVTPTDEFNEFKLTNTMVLPEMNNEDGSDVGSDTGTYTIDKESPEVVTARLSLDTTFGIDPSTSVCTKQEAKAWISEWASSTLNHKNSYNSSNSSLQHPKSLPLCKVSKIPSPMTKRASLGTRGKLTSSLSKPENVPKHNEFSNDNNLETESYLKTTEKVMTALAARMSVSLDSGGESDADSKSSNKKSIQRSDSSASESGPKPRETRYNRAFSLRRGRLEDDKKQESPKSIKPILNSTPRPSRSKPVTPIMPPPSGLTRTDNARLSLRSKAPPQSPVLSGPKSDIGVKKKSSGRSNSTLSSKEVEFQNWKRRKSYDPMKAAAEGKKKEAAKKVPANALTQSVGPVEATTPKSPVSSVLRSASFHGTRQLVGPSSSEEDEEITLSPEEEDWPATQAPKTSLENTPRGSRVSLYSNNSNSPRARHKLEGVDNIVVSAILGLSNKLKGNTSILVQKLRYLYDEESDKHKCLSLELEQLEMAENSNSPQKSSSKELAVTLKNLKRIDTTLKVLNEVVFENLDYE